MVMNLNAHTLSLSAYMTLMFTSAFMTLNLPGPLSFAAAGAGLDAAAQRLGVRFENLGMTLPAPMPAAFNTTAAGELKKAADVIESGELTSKLVAPLCRHFGFNDGSEPILAKSSSTGTVKPLDLRSIQVLRVDGKRHIVIAVYFDKSATWYLTDEDGTIRKAATKAVGGPVQDVPLAGIEAAFKAEKTFWLSRLGGEAPEVLVGRAGS